jgi:two-component system NarL family response regulator
MTIRLLLVDDQRVFREALRSFLDNESDLTVVGEAANGRDALRLARTLKPDVVVLDVAMPEMNGFETAARIRAQVPGIRILALSAHDDKRYVLGMLEAGVAGYVSKDTAARDLVQAIRKVAAGQSYLGPEVTEAVIGGMRDIRNGSASSALQTLGRREREVLQLLAEGHRSAEIASRLSIALDTVMAHRRNIMRKLNLHSISELTKFAVREGLTSL